MPMLMWSSMAKLVLFFIDGIGLAPESDFNPVASLFKDQTDGFGLRPIDGAARFTRSALCALDARLGVEGVPQSATGQTTLFTGVNAPAKLGYHLTAFPNEALLACFTEGSVMKLLAEKGLRVTSANMYSREFFDRREGLERNKFPASTLTIKASGVPFRMGEDYRAGKAVFADITNELIRSRGYDIDVIEPETAADRTLAILEENDFVFFEYFLTDTYGHKGNRRELEKCVRVLNRYVNRLSSGLQEDEALLIVSDHGNAEDSATASHTLNPVPGLLIGGSGEARERFLDCRSILDIHPFMLGFFS